MCLIGHCERICEKRIELQLHELEFYLNMNVFLNILFCTII
ncbi:hypothetical protein CLOSBL3_11440 [Clostridiaceae bacterium BL-3]|nr:hypothetical protein CLOSBL3_11440 [Clostridiaceae bacterium BL-3]